LVIVARECGPGRWVDFERTDRDYVKWGSSGLTGAATATVELESNGTFHNLAIDTETGDLTALFAGPDVVSPGGAIVVPETSHIEVHIVDGVITRTLDGGFIRLVP
jgi:hypothetical protein